MEKKQKQPEKTCTDCIHESACRGWTGGRHISYDSASQCPNHETVKESGAYLCGVLDERKRHQTHADRIRAMSDEELASWAKKQIGCGSGFFPCGVVCGGKCEAHSPEACRTLIMEWLKQPAEE